MKQKNSCIFCGITEDDDFIFPFAFYIDNSLIYRCKQNHNNMPDRFAYGIDLLTGVKIWFSNLAPDGELHESRNYCRKCK